LQGIVAYRQHDCLLAQTKYERALTIIYHEMGIKRQVAFCLEGLAAVAFAGNRPERAARLFGATQAHIEEFGFTTSRRAVIEYEQAKTDVRAALGEVAFTAAWDEGYSMSLEQAVDCALVL
jgi:hypothetical protein